MAKTNIFIMLQLLMFAATAYCMVLEPHMGTTTDMSTEAFWGNIQILDCSTVYRNLPGSTQQVSALSHMLLVTFYCNLNTEDT
jgi:hypothetical protein